SAVTVPVTADMERGYGIVPAELATRLLESGAVGLNYEDSAHDGSGGLVEAQAQAEAIAALAGAGLVVNARIDVHLRRVGDAAGTARPGSSSPAEMRKRSATLRRAVRSGRSASPGRAIGVPLRVSILQIVSDPSLRERSHWSSPPTARAKPGTRAASWPKSTR